MFGTPKETAKINNNTELRKIYHRHHRYIKRIFHCKILSIEKTLHFLHHKTFRILQEENARKNG